MEDTEGTPEEKAYFALCFAAIHHLRGGTFQHQAERDESLHVQFSLDMFKRDNPENRAKCQAALQEAEEVCLEFIKDIFPE